MIYTGGETVLEVDEDGTVTSVCHEADRSLPYLTGLIVSEVVIAGEVHHPGRPDVLLDADELVISCEVDGLIRIVVRHILSAGWGLRIAFAAIGDTALVLDDVRVAMCPVPGQVGWALAAGALASYCVQPAPTDRPLLAGSLRLGYVDRITADGLHLGRIELAGNRRFAFSWHWDWYPTPVEVGRSWPSTLPASLFATVGDVIEIGRDDDAALLVSDEVEMRETEDHIELVSDLVESHDVEQRSARGTVVVRLRWVPAVEDIVCDRAEAALLEPRTAAGVVRLTSLAEALMLQHALAQGMIADLEDAAEALDLYTARLTASSPIGQSSQPTSSLAAAYLCGEFHRSGDQDLLDQAVHTLSAVRSPEPGLGVAGTQVCLALVASGEEMAPVLAHLSAIATSIPPGDTSLERQIAELELLSVTSTVGAERRPSSAGTLSRAQARTQARGLTTRVAELGRWFGAGLTGEAVDPLPPILGTHLSTVLRLVPDGIVEDLRERWGCSPQRLGERAVPALVAGLEPGITDLSHVWLMLGRQPG